MRISFVKARWKPLVFTDADIDRRFYEICALSELKSALRSRDISVLGSREFRDFEDYLLPPDKFSAPKGARCPLRSIPTSTSTCLSACCC